MKFGCRDSASLKLTFEKSTSVSIKFVKNVLLEDRPTSRTVILLTQCPSTGQERMVIALLGSKVL